MAATTNTATTTTTFEITSFLHSNHNPNQHHNSPSQQPQSPKLQPQSQQASQSPQLQHQTYSNLYSKKTPQATSPKVQP